MLVFYYSFLKGHNMSNTVRKGKQNRHEKITVTLLSGKPVSPDEIKACFAGTDQESVLYRLSTNIYNIRLDGGIVKVIKEGRKVKAYQLVNYTEFDANGRYVGKPVTKNLGPFPDVVPQETTVSSEKTAEVVNA
jgi:hypothetical protein